MKKIKLLFIGDIFGESGVKTVEKILPKLQDEHQFDFVIAQGENVTGRKGLSIFDYHKLTNIGINAITMGNHVWFNEEIYQFINDSNVIRPFNIDESYQGVGTKVFDVKGIKLRVTSMMGISFNTLLKPWEHEYANNFFDAIDQINQNDNSDFHFLDFHAETTSEKYVFGLYCDKNTSVSAFCGTHTHVQTNDAKVFENGLCYITDAGMTGPENSAIGANYQEVYEKMRFDAKSKFQVSTNKTQFNGVIIELFEDKTRNKITPINIEHISI
ncbi:TIGR00282 family metallophosphoesterase [Mycoplasma corogypsi]|uniref:TIGR00282 family metallophosphoesterase n=1 Tax=Mycoplasma corogypsi TaxID=2106 RepID=UPI003872B0B1